ncbi:hypothetical protein [Calidifontibacillus erzurumensis]|uniref:hypothetical protein n=1 Tax=Calidifontibacillus erzurumensis TaxID=2741433 RepID=UPI0035B50241
MDIKKMCVYSKVEEIFEQSNDKQIDELANSAMEDLDKVKTDISDLRDKVFNLMEDLEDHTIREIKEGIIDIFNRVNKLEQVLFEV